MFINPLDSNTIIGQNGTAEIVAPRQMLGQDDFLKLLITQLTSQDPLNPEKNTDFIAQMAQFSSLQTSQGIQSDLSGLRADQQLLQANSLLGRTVTLLQNDGTPTSGLVSSVQVEAGMPQIVVNGQNY